MMERMEMIKMMEMTIAQNSIKASEKRLSILRRTDCVYSGFGFGTEENICRSFF